MTVLHAEIAVPAALLRAAPHAGLTPNEAVEVVLAHWASECELLAQLNGTTPESVMTRLMWAELDLAERRASGREGVGGRTQDEVRAELGRRLEERAKG